MNMNMEQSGLNGATVKLAETLKDVFIEGFQPIEIRMDRLEDQLDRVNERMDAAAKRINSRINDLENLMNSRMDNLEDGAEERMRSLERNVQALLSDAEGRIRDDLKKHA